jgi:hypothetical protein
MWVLIIIVALLLLSGLRIAQEYQCGSEILSLAAKASELIDTKPKN